MTILSYLYIQVYYCNQKIYNLLIMNQLPTSFLLLSVLCILSATSLSAPQLTKFTISSYIGPTKDISMQLDVVTPKSYGTYPAIMFVSGLSSLIPSSFYSRLIQSVAQSGNAWMTVSRLTSPNPEKITHALTHVLDWINDNIENVFKNRVPGVVPDIHNRFTLIGHSGGGHVSTEYLNNTCGNIKLQILLDPVDGVDPFGMKKDYIVVPGKYLPYATPVLVLRTQLDPKSRIITDPPCAPQNLSNQRFYNAMRGPRWFLNISKYGHADFLNVEYRDVAAAICPTCHKDCNYTEYRELIKEVIVSFSNAIFNQNKTALSQIEEGRFAIPTFSRHQYNGFNPMGGGFCKRYNSFNVKPDSWQKSEEVGHLIKKQE